MKKALVSVTGVDKPGIIAKVSTELYTCHVNVLEISQTVLDGYFTMMMIADITGLSCSFGEIRQKLNDLGNDIGVAISIQRTDIFDAMHRI